jgi:hypothetical protein
MIATRVAMTQMAANTEYLSAILRQDSRTNLSETIFRDREAPRHCADHARHKCTIFISYRKHCLRFATVLALVHVMA